MTPSLKRQNLPFTTVAVAMISSLSWLRVDDSGVSPSLLSRDREFLYKLIQVRLTMYNIMYVPAVCHWVSYRGMEPSK